MGSQLERLPAPELPSWLAAMVPFERYCIRIDGKQMHVMETRQGTPVLLLHGNPTWGFLYRKVVQRLSGSRLRCIMPDLIGLGFSEKPRDAREHTLEKHATRIGALIDALGLSELVFVGQDWGGAIGGCALAARP